MKFYERLLIAPITALHFVQDNILLAGEGPVLHVYNVISEKEASSAKVLQHASIHGLKSETRRNVNDTKVCVFGCKSARVISLVDTRQSIHCVTDGREFEDWIWDVQWLHEGTEGTSDEDSSLALALGHNSVAKWQWRTDVILHHIHCEETCILYCAKFIGSSWHTLMLAAGTVFNQVALWSVGGHLAKGKCARVLYRLKGHQGVIFAIDFHQDRMQICSASDDRSIRLWQLHCHGDRGSVMNWKDITFEQLCVFYGHSARVWGARLLSDHIVSIGEDATCVIWNYNGEVVQKFKGHKGKSVWSLAVNPSETALATGGGDSSVRLWRHLKGTDELNQYCRQQMLNLPQYSSLLPQQPVLVEDFPRSVHLLAGHCLLIMTNNGCLWLHSLTTGQSTQILMDARFASYSVLAPAPDGRCILLGSMTGWLKILTSPGQEFCSMVASSGNYEEQIHEDGKIYAINWLMTNADTGGYQFLTTGPGGALIVWRLTSDLLTRGHPAVSVQRLYQFLLPYTKQRWVTAALLLASSDILMCGDRGGTVHMFRLNEQQNPQQSLHKIHGKAGVTDIHYHDNYVYSCGRDGQFRKYTTDGNGLHLLSSNKVFKGFDWISRLLFHEDDLLVMGFHTDQFIVYSVGRNQRMLTVSCGGGHRVWDFTLSPGGEGRFVFIKNKTIVVCDASFLANQTILKSSVHGREMTDVKYLFSSIDNSSFYLATASEDTTVNILQVTKCSMRDGEHRHMYRVLASMQAHISSVRALCVSALKHHTESGDGLLFSAGGRAQLNAWRVHFQEGSGGNGTQPQVSQGGNVSRIGDNMPLGTGDNTPCPLPEDGTGDNVPGCDTQVTGTSSSHKAILTTPPGSHHGRITHQPVGGSTAVTGGAICWHRHLASHMLLQRGHRRRKSWKTATCDAGPETRYMAVCAVSLRDLDHRLCPLVHILTTACSDGYIRIFSFDESDGSFCLIAQSDFHDHCVLIVKHFIVTTSTNQRRAHILSAGTDGRIAFWDITDIAKKCVFSEEKYSAVTTNEELEHDPHELKQSSMKTGVSSSHALTAEELLEMRRVDMSDSHYNMAAAPSGGYTETEKDFPHDSCDQCDGDGNDRTFEKEFPSELEPVFVLEAHQSGVNAVDIRTLKEGSCSRYIVASGGDDNALHVAILETTKTDQDKTPVLVLHDTTNIPAAHSAQITGVRILDDNTILTSSIDQRVTVWTLVTQPKLQLQMRVCHCISVSDAVGLDVFTDQ